MAVSAVAARSARSVRAVILEIVDSLCVTFIGTDHGRMDHGYDAKGHVAMVRSHVPYSRDLDLAAESYSELQAPGSRVRARARDASRAVWVLCGSLCE